MNDVCDKIQELLVGHEHDAFVTHLLKAISSVTEGMEKVTGNCLGAKVTCYKAGSIIRIDLQ